MTSPRRLREEGTEFERDLLESARLDAGSDDGLKRTLMALGAGKTLTATATHAGAAVATATTAGPAGTAAAAGSGAGAAVLVKWVGISAALLAVGGGATLSARSLVRSSSAESATPARPQLSAPAPGFASQPAETSLVASPSPAAIPAAAPPLPRAIADRPPLAPHPLPPVNPRIAATGVAQPAGASTHPPPAREDGQASGLVEVAPAGPATPSSPPSLEEQVLGLERARAFLLARDAPRALATLDAYDRAFPGSALADEATVLRVEALLAAGDGEGAGILARRFLARNPSSPHASRLLQLLRDKP